jgi:hypothetical protein
MVKVELITVTGSGTRSIEKLMSEHFEIFNYPRGNLTKGDEEGVFVSTHFDADHHHRLMNSKNTLILCTWRDPLRTCIHNLYKGRKQVTKQFVRLQELRKHKPVLMIDMNCVPLKEGEWEVRNSSLKDDNELRRAYDRKDIEYIEKIMPATLNWLRDFDWNGLWTEDWWR